MHPNNPWEKEEISRVIKKKYIDLNENKNKNTTYQNCGTQLKQCLQESLQHKIHTLEKRKPQINHLSSNFKMLEKEEQNKYKQTEGKK